MNTFWSKSSTKQFLFSISFLFFFSISIAQTEDSTQIRIEKNKYEKLLNSYKDKQASLKRNKGFQELLDVIHESLPLISKKIDYKALRDEMKQLENMEQNATFGITSDKKYFPTIQNLSATAILLDELTNRNQVSSNKISKSLKQYTEIQSKLDSLLLNKDLYTKPTEFIDKFILAQQKESIERELKTIQSNVNQTIDSLQYLQIDRNLLNYIISEDVAKINGMLNSELENISTSKTPIFQANNDLNYFESLAYSFEKNGLILIYYCFNQLHFVLMLIAFIILAGFFIKLLHKKYKKADIMSHFDNKISIFENPFSTAIVVVGSFFLFVFPNPPFIVTSSLWLLIAIAIVMVIKDKPDALRKRIWYQYYLLAAIVWIDHITLLSTITATVLLLIFCGLAFFFGISLLRKHYKEIEKPLLILIVISTLMELLAIYSAINQNYNVAKLYAGNGMFIILVYSFLYYTFNFSNDIIELTAYLKDGESSKHFNLLHNKSHAASIVTFVILSAAWLVLMSKNSIFAKKLVDPVLNAISEQRQIGQFSFSFENVITFILIIFLANLLAKVVALLTVENKWDKTKSKDSFIGSYMLLIKIGIMSCGFMLAFASAGIPIDRITMIISALGVGIGFGLQNIVNNVVSGLIIVFDKPVHIDDIVSIGGQIGKMKTIGIRSSVITTGDGADVIIPNGDLLSQRLTNWTLGNSTSRFELNIGVAYGTNLAEAQKCILDILAKNQTVLSDPAPSCLIIQFGESSIDIQIRYWVAHFDFGNRVKSEIIIAIDQAFREKGIEIPFPHRVLQIKQDDSAENQEN